jgi:hypothetical protein
MVKTHIAAACHGAQHGEQELPVGHPLAWLEPRDPWSEHDGQGDHEDRRHDEDGPPAEVLGDDAAQGTGDEQADHDPGGDRAEHLATLVVAGEVPCERDDELTGDRAEADEGQRAEQDRVAGRRSRGQQEHRGEQHEPGDHPAPVDGVPEWHQEEHPHGVPDLRHRDDQPCGPGRDREVVADDRQERLRPVEVPDGGSGGDREEQGEPPAQPWWAGRLRARPGRAGDTSW